MNVKSFLVFTNDTTEVKNLNKEINPCFLGQLHSLINQETKSASMTLAGLNYVAECISKEVNKGLYQAEFDAKKYKHEFAFLLVGLEELKNSKTKAEEPVLTISNDNEPPTKKKVSQTKRQRIIVPSQYILGDYLKKKIKITTPSSTLISRIPGCRFIYRTH